MRKKSFEYRVKQTSSGFLLQFRRRRLPFFWVTIAAFEDDDMEYAENCAFEALEYVSRDI